MNDKKLQTSIQKKSLMISCLNIFLLLSMIVLNRLFSLEWFPILNEILIYFSIVTLTVYLILFFTTLIKFNDINIKESILFITPFVLLIISADSQNDKSKIRESLKRIGGISSAAYIDLGLYFKDNRIQSFEETYRLIEELDRELIIESGGMYGQMELAGGLDVIVPNRYMFLLHNKERLDEMISYLITSIHDEKYKKQVKIIYNGLFNEKIIKNNTVSEMHLRFNALSVQLKNVELSLYFDRQ